MSGPAEPSDSTQQSASPENAVAIPERPTVGFLFTLLLLFIVASVGAVTVLVFQGVLTALDVEPGPTRDLWNLIAALSGTWLGLMMATLLPFALNKTDVRKALGLAFKPKVDIPLGIAAGLLGQYVLVFLTYLPVYFFDPNIFDQVGEKANELAKLAVGWGVIPFVLSTCLFAPIFEELFFRGLVLRSFLAKWKPIWAILISGLIFGAFHFDPLLLAGLSLFGVLLGFIAHKTGRIGACIVAHMAFNSATVVTTVFFS